ncbi:MAG: ribosomal protein S18-alanine N-acetyltransferase [Thermodesulfovibrionales bacterium]
MAGEAETVISAMTTEDIPRVLAIELASFTTPWSEILFFNETKKERSIALVARKDDAVAGYICANYVLDEGHILDLAVHPDYRRQGVATLLIREALERLKRAGCGTVFLDVRASNLAARTMYEKIGFRLCGTRKNYYQKPDEDATLLVLSLGADSVQPQRGEPFSQ